MSEETKEKLYEAAENFGTLFGTIFLQPVWFMLAWNGWAWQFNLPQFSYWHWVVTCAALRCLGGYFASRSKKAKKEG